MSTISNDCRSTWVAEVSGCQVKKLVNMNFLDPGSGLMLELFSSSFSSLSGCLRFSGMPGKIFSQAPPEKKEALTVSGSRSRVSVWRFKSQVNKLATSI